MNPILIILIVAAFNAPTLIMQYREHKRRAKILDQFEENITQFKTMIEEYGEDLARIRSTTDLKESVELWRYDN